VQSSSQIITTNKPTSSFFTGRMPFLSPNQQCQSTEGKLSHSMDLLTPSSPGGIPTLSLTTTDVCPFNAENKQCLNKLEKCQFDFVHRHLC